MGQTVNMMVWDSVEANTLEEAGEQIKTNLDPQLTSWIGATSILWITYEK